LIACCEQVTLAVSKNANHESFEKAALSFYASRMQLGSTRIVGVLFA
jgi:hypothetical protein